MLHRLPSTISGRKPTLNEIQPDLHPLEVLFDVTKLMDEQNVVWCRFIYTNMFKYLMIGATIKCSFCKNL